MGTTVAALVVAPLALPVLAAADASRGRLKLPSVRVYLFSLQYLINDSVEIILAPLYWLAAGFGTRLGAEASLARHERLQWWSVRLLVKRAEQLLGLRVKVAAGSNDHLGPGPVIVLSRHASLFDASLPGLLYAQHGYRVRGIVMAELLADPGFDLLYGRLGSVFIPRDDGSAARTAVAAMTANADERTAYVIFPEGRLFRQDALSRSLERMAARDPARAERLAGLRHVLPPRPGGLQTLLAALPTADVVVVDHRGLEAFTHLAALTVSAPVDSTVEISARRIARSEIPEGPAAQVAWLDHLWLDLDAGLST